MIVSFSVSNYRSFAAEETFSLVASNRLAGRHDDHAVPIPDSSERVLRTAVLYGANGAGKSNLFKALQYLKALALDARPKGSGTGRDAFRFGSIAADPTVFDLQFIASGKLYRFGVKIDDEKIREEWLVRVVGGREKTIYERVTGDDGVVIDATGLEGVKVRALASVGGPQNQSFLATARTTLEAADLGGDMGSAAEWFRCALGLIGPTDSLTQLGQLLSSNPDLRSFTGDFLKNSSTGIDHLSVRTNDISREEAGSLLSSHFAGRGFRELAASDGSALYPIGQGDLVVARRSGSMARVTVRTAHEHEPGHAVPMELNEESDGTRRLLDLIPALHELQTRGCVCVIDEIDRSLHPMLVRSFLEQFLREGKGSQLIMTTHESNLLDQELLRRDEIWFAEKDPAGATHIYSLMDFKVRNDLEIRKHYLQGRFGAVPFLGDPARLPVENSQPL